MSIDPSSRTEVDSHSAPSLHSSPPVVGEHPKAAEEKKHTSSSIETKKSSPTKTSLAVPEKISATLAEQQLTALLTEAQTYQATPGYEHQIKAAFYYQVALAFCDKKLLALTEVGKTEAKKPEARENKGEATVSSKDWAACYTAEKEKIIQALATLESAYSQKALELPASIVFGSTPSFSESKISSASLPSHDLFVKRLVVNPYKLELQRIRAKAAALLETYKKQSTVVTAETKAESKSILTMQGIYRELTADMKQLIRQMIADCIEEYSLLLGYPPCEYAFFGLGSMARDEMTPYSDLEFGILIAEEDKSGINKTYFQHITRVLHLKIINLGETIPRIMGVELPTIKIHTGVKIEQDEIPNLIPNGLSFDGVGPGGCKNPFGRKDKFVLLGTPQALADYQDPKHYDDQGKLQDERFLPASLTHVTLIAGGNAGQLLESRPKVTSDSSVAGEGLLEQYRKAVHHTLDQPATSLWGNPLTGKKFILRQARALELLLSDLERFSPKLGKVEADGRSFSVKHDFYRLPNTLLDQLALYYGLEAQSLWEQINRLAVPSTESKSALVSEEAARNLRRAIDSIGYHRLSAYLRLGEQNEEARLDDDKGVVRTYGATHQRYYELSASDAFAIYYCLIPLWQAMKRFRDSAGNQEAFQASCVELYSDSPFIKGQIKQLLQGHHAALPDYEESVVEARQLAEALALSFKTPVAEAKEGKEEKKSIQKELASSSDIPSKELADALYALGTVQRELRQSADAETNLKEAHRNFQALGRYAIAETGACLLSLALLLKTQGKTRATEAQKYLAEATDLIQQQYGKRHPYFAHCVAIRGELESTFRHMTPDWHIPLSNDETFVGREDLLKQLADQFVAMEAGQRLLLSAVSGLGGVGKTTLAIQYLHHSKHPYELRVWFRAESATTLSADYRDFAIEKRLIEPGDKINIKELISLVKHYLEKHTGWLAVYDNVENYEDIKDYLPAKGGHVIVSTRRQEWPSFWPAERTAGWGKLTVDVFTLEEALLYLKKMTGRSGVEEEASMKLLAEELGRLPLALAQAAAYIKQRGVTVADYLNRYEQRKRELLADKLLPAGSESLPVASTWDISLAHILDEEGLLMTPERSVSWNILHAMSYLHSEDIPCALLERWLQDVGHCKDAVSAKQQLETALERLQSYSLVHYHPDKQTVSLHRLVQTVMRERLDLQPRKEAKEEKETKTVDVSDSKGKKQFKLEISQESLGIEAAISQAKIGRGQAKQGKLLEAEQSLREAIALFKRYDKSYAAELSKCYLDLAVVLVQKERETRGEIVPGEAKLSEEVTGCIQEAQDLVAAQYGAAHPLVARCAHIELYLKTPLSAGKRAIWNWQLPAESTSFIKRDNHDQYFNQVTHSFDARLAHKQAPLTVLLGLAGIGKTTLAKNYVHKLEYPYDLRIWFQADSPTILLNEYRTFAKDLGLLPHEAKVAASEGEILYAVKSYLESYPDWLVVYDNAGSYRSLKKFLPTRGGHILVTTCRREWQDVARVTLEIIKLAQEMKEEDTKRLGKLWEKQLESIQQLEEQGGDKPLSRLLLQLMMERAKEEGTPCSLSRTFLENWMFEQKIASDASQAKIDTDKALGYLQNYLLIAVSEDRLKVTVHPLLQRMLHLGIEFEKCSIPLVKPLESKSETEAIVSFRHSFHFPLLRSLTDSILKEFNLEIHVLVDEKRKKALLMHMQALLKRHDTLGRSSTSPSADLSMLLVSIGNIFIEQHEDGGQAKRYYERALSIQEHHYGKDNWKVARTLVNLGSAYGALGDAATKRTLLERALSIQEHHYGKDHWQMAITLNNLATACGALGDAATKKTLLKRVLSILEQHYGNDHWQVAITLNNLANACGALGEAATKKMLLERALPIKEQYYGKEHWQVAITLNNLANAYGALGDAATKKTLLERALPILEQHYGKDHWQVARTLSDLGSAFGDLGDLVTKKSLLERTLPILEQHFGKDHSQVAITLNKLACTYQQLGDIVAAISYARETYRIFTANFKNPDHPDIKRADRNLKLFQSIRQLITKLCQPTILTLLQKGDMETAGHYFESENADMADFCLHICLAGHYEKQKNYVGAIVHLKLALSFSRSAKEPEARLRQLHVQLTCSYLCHQAALKQTEKPLIEQQQAEALAKQHFDAAMKSLFGLKAPHEKLLSSQMACYKAMVVKAVSGDLTAVREVFEVYRNTLPQSPLSPSAGDAKVAAPERKRITSEPVGSSLAVKFSDNPHRFLPLSSTQEVKAVSHLVSQQARENPTVEDELQKALQLSLSLNQNSKQQDVAKPDEAVMSEEEQLKLALQMSLGQ